MITLLLGAHFLCADMVSMEPSPAFHDRKEWFAAFLKNTDQKEVQKQTTLYILKEHFPHLWERIQDAETPFASIFVGAGSGGMEIPLLEEFAKMRGSVTNFTAFCEDPSPQMKKEFVAAAKGEIEGQIAEYSLLPFEDPSYAPPQADLALASHAWYFIDGWRGVEKERNTLAKFASLVSERSGVGIITLQSKTGDRYKFNASCAALRGLDEELVAEKVAAELRRLGIQHETMRIESRMNITSCFEQGLFKPNEEGKNLLSFLFFTSWDDLPAAAQEEMKAKLVDEVRKNGKEELVLRDFHIWIPGNQNEEG